jgi:hypothetical protein
VLLKHYVEESDPELREASNRTYRRNWRDHNNQQAEMAATTRAGDRLGR